MAGARRKGMRWVEGYASKSRILCIFVLYDVRRGLPNVIWEQLPLLGVHDLEQQWQMRDIRSDEHLPTRVVQEFIARIQDLPHLIALPAPPAPFRTRHTQQVPQQAAEKRVAPRTAPKENPPSYIFFEAEIVFDWDDTLFCTSFMQNLLQGEWNRAGEW